jgi:hypothetical protein
MLTGKDDGYFTISELEVWEVKYLVINKIKLIYIHRIELNETTERDRRNEKYTHLTL